MTDRKGYHRKTKTDSNINNSFFRSRDRLDSERELLESNSNANNADNANIINNINNTSNNESSNFPIFHFKSSSSVLDEINFTNNNTNNKIDNFNKKYKDISHLLLEEKSKDTSNNNNNNNDISSIKKSNEQYSFNNSKNSNNSSEILKNKVIKDFIINSDDSSSININRNLNKINNLKLLDNIFNYSKSKTNKGEEYIILNDRMNDKINNNSKLVINNNDSSLKLKSKKESNLSNSNIYEEFVKDNRSNETAINNKDNKDNKDNKNVSISNHDFMKSFNRFYSEKDILKEGFTKDLKKNDHEDDNNVSIRINKDNKENKENVDIIPSILNTNNNNNNNNTITNNRASNIYNSSNSVIIAKRRKSLFKEIEKEIENNTKEDNELSFLIDYKKELMQSEDENYTEFMFTKVKINEGVSFIMNLSAISTSVLTRYLQYSEDYYFTPVPSYFLDSTLIICSILHFLLIVLIIFKYLDYFELYKASRLISKDTSFISTNLFYYFILEMFLTVSHPNIFLKDIEFQTSVSWNLKNVELYYNDILLVLNLCRFYLFYFALIAMTKYYSGRSNRISKMLSIDFNMFFSFKCIVTKHPIATQIAITGIFCLFFALIFQSLEGSVVGDYKPINFNDAIWVVFIIITTVGFGDIVSQTNLGRLSMIIISLVGIFLVSLIIMSLEKEIKLSEYEIKAFNLVSRLEAKEENKKLSAQYFNTGIKYILAKKEYKLLIRDKHTKIMNRTKIEKKKKLLKELLYKKVFLKNCFKRKLRIFYNNFEPYNLEDTMKKRIIEINDSFALFKQREERMGENLKKICCLIEFMEKTEVKDLDAEVENVRCKIEEDGGFDINLESNENHFLYGNDGKSKDKRNNGISVVGSNSNSIISDGGNSKMRSFIRDKVDIDKVDNDILNFDYGENYSKIDFAIINCGNELTLKNMNTIREEKFDDQSSSSKSNKSNKSISNSDKIIKSHSSSFSDQEIKLKINS